MKNRRINFKYKRDKSPIELFLMKNYLFILIGILLGVLMVFGWRYMKLDELETLSRTNNNAKAIYDEYYDEYEKPNWDYEDNDAAMTIENLELKFAYLDSHIKSAISKFKEDTKLTEEIEINFVYDYNLSITPLDNVVTLSLGFEKDDSDPDEEIEEDELKTAKLFSNNLKNDLITLKDTLGTLSNFLDTYSRTSVAYDDDDDKDTPDKMVNFIKVDISFELKMRGK